MRPLAVELYAGSFGWSAGWTEQGGRAIGFDIEHCSHHGPIPQHCELVLQDVCTLHGAQLKDAAIILASPPCQEFSYRAMPWKRAKALGPPVNGINLFWQCWRIQQEACEAAGRYIPMVVENVKGAQPWVGTARWHYGSFYLWGDVPALMPMTVAIKCAVDLNWSRKDGKPSLGFNTSTDALTHGRKVPGFNFHEYEKNGKPGRLFQSAAVDGLKVPSEEGRRADPGKGARFTTRDCGIEGTKYAISGHAWYRESHGQFSSKSSARKAASAAIARIPFPLSQHIASVYLHV